LPLGTTTISGFWPSRGEGISAAGSDAGATTGCPVDIFTFTSAAKLAAGIAAAITIPMSTPAIFFIKNPPF
jgi:hypothetical protein